MPYTTHRPFTHTSDGPTTDEEKKKKKDTAKNPAGHQKGRRARADQRSCSTPLLQQTTTGPSTNNMVRVFRAENYTRKHPSHTISSKRALGRRAPLQAPPQPSRMPATKIEGVTRLVSTPPPSPAGTNEAFNVSSLRASIFRTSSCYLPLLLLEALFFSTERTVLVAIIIVIIIIQCKSEART